MSGKKTISFKRQLKEVVAALCLTAGSASADILSTGKHLQETRGAPASSAMQSDNTALRGAGNSRSSAHPHRELSETRLSAGNTRPQVQALLCTSTSKRRCRRWLQQSRASLSNPGVTYLLSARASYSHLAVCCLLWYHLYSFPLVWHGTVTQKLRLWR